MNTLHFTLTPYSLQVSLVDENEKELKDSIAFLDGDINASTFLNSVADYPIKSISSATLIISRTEIKTKQQQHLTLTPKDLESYLYRQCQKEWNQEQEFVWSQTALQPNKAGKKQTLLQILPANYTKAFLSFCTENQIKPLHAVTLPMVTSSYAQSICEKGNQLLIAVDTFYSVLFTMVNDSGCMMIREIPYSLENDQEQEFQRISKELQRTFLYAKQQYSFNADAMVLIGRGLCEYKKTLSQNIDIENIIEKEEHPNWHSELLNINPKTASNLIPLDILLLDRNIKIAKYSFVASVLFLIIGLSSAITMFRLEQKVTHEIESLDLRNKYQDLLKQKDSLLLQQAELTKRQDIATLLQQAKYPPISGWFYSFIADIIPNKIVMREGKISFQKETQNWFFSIKGLSPRDPILSAALLQQFQDTMKKELNGLNISSSWELKWIQILHTGNTEDPESFSKEFEISGSLF